VVVPEVLFMPLIGFTAKGDRLGQGGGYYDRFLAAHPQTIAIGMAWDVQEVDELPVETARHAPVGDRHADAGARPVLMRDKPTLRIPLGILALLAALGVYALAVAWASQWIGHCRRWCRRWPTSFSA
jgi:hypothetical protein